MKHHSKDNAPKGAYCKRKKWYEYVCFEKGSHVADEVPRGTRSEDCKSCEFRKICIGSLKASIPKKRCSTCSFIDHKKYKCVIVDSMLENCEYHVYNPDLISFDNPIQFDSKNRMEYMTFINGKKHKDDIYLDKDVFTSKELEEVFEVIGDDT